MEIRKLKIGDHVRVTVAYWDATIRGATGIIAEPSESIRGHIQPDCFWVEFDEWIPAGNPEHPTEAAEVLAEGLELLL